MKLYVFTKISTHSLTRRLTRKQKLRRCYSLDFNSQPHKEADSVFVSLVFILLISTHSLTRRLTEIPVYYWEKENISTHSLTRRLTRNICFFKIPFYISTHSLTRRLTREDSTIPQ